MAVLVDANITQRTVSTTETSCYSRTSQSPDDTSRWGLALSDAYYSWGLCCLCLYMYIYHWFLFAIYTYFICTCYIYIHYTHIILYCIAQITATTDMATADSVFSVRDLGSAGGTFIRIPHGSRKQLHPGTTLYYTVLTSRILYYSIAYCILYCTVGRCTLLYCRWSMGWYYH